MNQMETLQAWRGGVSLFQEVHFRCATLCERRHLYFGVPVVVISAVTGTAVFATIESNPATWAKILIGMLSLIGAVFATLQTFFRHSELAQKHKHAAVQYGQLRREVEEAIETHGDDQQDLRDFMTSFRTKWDEVDQESPTTPQRIHDSVVAARSAAGR